MCALKAPMPQLISNTSVRVVDLSLQCLVPGFLLKLRAELALFSARKRWGLCPPIFLGGGGGGRGEGYDSPAPPPINAYTFAISLVSSGVGRKLQ